MQEKIRCVINKTNVIYQRIKNNYNIDPNTSVEIKTTHFNPNKYLDKNKSIDKLGYIPIKRYIKHSFLQLTHKSILKLHIKNIIVNLTIFHVNTYEDLVLIRKIIQRVICMIKTFTCSKKIKYYDNLQIHMYLYDAPRILPKTFTKTPDEMFDIGNKNYFNCTCGYAMHNKNNFIVCVTRKNGCLGLLTHELCHICELDLSFYDVNKHEYIIPTDRLRKWQDFVKEYFNISDECQIGNMSEGINNGNSSIIHSMFLSLESNDSYEKYYEQEVIHDIVMLKKLFRYFQMTSVKHIFKNYHSVKFNQTSQLLEYILIRCVYLMNFEELNLLTKNLLSDQDDTYFVTFVKCFIGSIHKIDNFKIPLSLQNENMEYYCL